MGSLGDNPQKVPKKMPAKRAQEPKWVGLRVAHRVIITRAMVIRTEQMARFGQSARDGFEARLLSHIEEFFPVHWRKVGQERMRAVVRLGITKAGSYGLETQREIYLFVSLMLYLGSHFDTDGQLPWAAASLNDTAETDAFMRVERTYDLAMEYLERVAGPAGQYLMSAIERFAKVAQELNRGSSAPLADVLRWTYPEKYRKLSEAQVNQLARHGQECVKKYDLGSPLGALLCAELAFLLGHGFPDDPQFSWAADVLQNPEFSDPGARLTTLRDAAVTHLSHWSVGTGRSK